MFCYECDQHGSAVGAIAICQRCGGAVCRKHARTLYQPGAPGGMLGLTQPKQEHVCARCLTGDFVQPSLPSTHDKTKTRVSELPDALSAVRIAETLVRGQSTRQDKKLSRWQRLRNRAAQLLIAGQAWIPGNRHRYHSQRGLLKSHSSVSERN
jgi:hypothetical protein